MTPEELKSIAQLLRGLAQANNETHVYDIAKGTGLWSKGNAVLRNLANRVESLATLPENLRPEQRAGRGSSDLVVGVEQQRRAKNVEEAAELLLRELEHVAGQLVGDFEDGAEERAVYRLCAAFAAVYSMQWHAGDPMQMSRRRIKAATHVHEAFCALHESIAETLPKVAP